MRTSLLRDRLVTVERGRKTSMVDVGRLSKIIALVKSE